MTGKEFKAGALAKLGEGGAVVNMEIFAKALAKAKRHMTAKYGGLKYDTEFSECGYDNVVYFYSETTAVPDGGKTFNRERYLSNR